MNNKYNHLLKHMGLLNIDAEPLSSQTGYEKDTYSGYCTSELCCGEKSRVLRTHRKALDKCIECGNYLFWEKDIKIEWSEKKSR